MPTLLQLASTTLPSGLEGQVLPGYFQNNTLENQNIYVVEAKSSPNQGPLNKATFALVQEQYKLIYYRGYLGFDEVYEMYDLLNDPEEIRDIYSDSNPIAKQLKEQLILKLAKF